MKRIAFALLLCMLLLCSCNNADTDGISADEDKTFGTVAVPEGTDSFYINEAIKLTKESGELARSKEFVAMYTADGEVAEKIKSAGELDFDKPKEILFVTFNKDKALEHMKEAFGETDVDFEKVIELNRFSVNQFASMINARYGAQTIAAVSMLSNSEGYIMPKDFEKDFTLYLKYDGEFSSIVSFSKYGEGVISANMMFVKNGEEQIDMLMNEIFETLGEESISIETVEKTE